MYDNMIEANSLLQLNDCETPINAIGSLYNQ